MSDHPDAAAESPLRDVETADGREPEITSGPQRLPAAARWLFHLTAAVQLIPTGVFITLAGIGLSFAVPWAVAVGGAAVLLGLQLLAAIVLPSLSYARWRWELRADALLISHGVFFRERTAIPLGRIQHVDVRQGPLETWLGLARLHVHTASGALGADGMIPGLEVMVAERLRDALVASVRAHEDDGV